MSGTHHEYQPVAIGDSSSPARPVDEDDEDGPSTNPARGTALQMVETPNFKRPGVLDITSSSSALSLSAINGTNASASDKSTGLMIGSIVTQNNLPVPISRPPTKARDSLFALAFLVHFALVGLLSMVEGRAALEGSIIGHSVAGSWSSMTMIVILLGGFLGVVLCATVAYVEWRETLLSLGILLSITMQACLGNVLLLLTSQYSFLGVFVLFSAMLDSCSYKRARENLSFTSALIQMVVDIFKHYGMSLIVAVIGIIIAQTCILLWWGAFFVELISNVSATSAQYLIIIMGLSLYWIANFFHAFMGYLVGGCVLWYFVGQEMSTAAGFNPTKRVLLHMHCGLTTSLGSICKGALFCPISERILAIHNWSSRSSNYGTSIAMNQLRSALLALIHPLVREARKYHKLTFCLTATYGRTLCKAAEEQWLFHPETIDISVEDNTAFTLAATATHVAGLVSIMFGIVAERQEGASWPLFFLVCFCLSYCGLSLAIHVFNSAIDAIIVAFGANPELFARENQIVFLRFIRHSETGLR